MWIHLVIRVSEALALRWANVDWLPARLSVTRGVVNQIVDEVKTVGSARAFNLTPELQEWLEEARRRSEFAQPENWIFASSIQFGRLPYS